MLEHFSDINKLNHAYYVIGNPRVNAQIFSEHFKSICDDTYIVETHIFNRLKLEDAHVVRARAHEHGKSIVIIATSFAQHEAQNSLLKAIEEPTIGTHYIFCVPTRDTFFQTIQSRCVIISQSDSDKNISSEGKINLGDFLSLSYQERLDLIKKESKDKDEDGWTHEDILTLIHQLEEYFHKTHSVGSMQDTFRVLETMRGYLVSPSASIGMIMDMIALSVPQNIMFTPKV